jgi:hypothetical protein
MEPDNSKETQYRLLRLEQSEERLNKKIRDLELQVRQLSKMTKTLENRINRGIVINGR